MTAPKYVLSLIMVIVIGSQSLAEDGFHQYPSCKSVASRFRVQSEEIAEALRTRISIALFNSQRNVACILMASLDTLLNESSVELEHCFDTAAAEALQMQSAQIGFEMLTLRCRQVNGLLVEQE